MPKIIFRYLQISKFILKSKFTPFLSNHLPYLFSLGNLAIASKLYMSFQANLTIDTVDCISEMFLNSALSCNFMFFSAIILQTILHPYTFTLDKNYIYL